MTVQHFVILMKHMWKKDWHQYRHPRILVQDLGAYLLFIYTFAGVGEYFESNMRRGSGRGLWYKVSKLTFAAQSSHGVTTNCAKALE